MSGGAAIKEITSFPVTGEIRAIGCGGGRVVWLLSDGALMEWRGGGTPVMLYDTAAEIVTNEKIDPYAPADIAVFGAYTAICNRYGRYGMVIGDDYVLRMNRDGYQAEDTAYPMAFLERDGKTHLLFAQGWNHLQIADLETRRVLTAEKSLLTEGAEERHLAYYRDHEEVNKLLWPAEYDYFYGRLKVSPDKEHFLSLGWVWGAFDALVVYETADFLENPRIRESVIFGGENLRRNGCFVGNDRVAVPVKPDLDDYGYDGGEEIPWELRLYNLDGVEVNGIALPGLNLVKASLASVNGLVCLWGADFGFAAVDMERGEVVYRDAEFCPAAFDEETGHFLTCEDGVVGLWRLV